MSSDEDDSEVSDTDSKSLRNNRGSPDEDVKDSKSEHRHKHRSKLDDERHKRCHKKLQKKRKKHLNEHNI